MKAYPECLDKSLTMTDTEWEEYGTRCKKECRHRNRIHKKFIRNHNIPLRFTLAKDDRDNDPLVRRAPRRKTLICTRCTATYYIDTPYEECNSPARDLCDECISSISWTEMYPGIVTPSWTLRESE